MTTTESATGAHAAIAGKYQPIIDRIGEGALDRERRRVLPDEAIRWLRDAGFGAVRVPQEHGGDGASVVVLTELLISLAAADANVAQALRGHFAFVEDHLFRSDSPTRTRWLERFAAGELVGSAWTEIGPAAVGTVDTVVVPDADGHRLTGTKFYSTGSIFADWVDVLARRPDGEIVFVAVRTGQDGVRITDDWDGFGQRTTGSGTAVFSGAGVDPDDLYGTGERCPYQTAFLQHVLVSTQAGIGRAVVDDVAGQVRRRSRVYSHGTADRTRDDPQLLQVVGEVAAAAFAARGAALAAAETLDAAYATRGGSADRQRSAAVAADLASAAAQITVNTLVPQAATRLFDALGASAARESVALDRHWRNARTIASHNPTVFKARMLGDWEVNETDPQLLWAIGESPDRASTAGSEA
jgi:alkylation response protein AidB-like acyl-CoA dehydrogenase